MSATSDIVVKGRKLGIYGEAPAAGTVYPGKLLEWTNNTAGEEASLGAFSTRWSTKPTNVIVALSQSHMNKLTDGTTDAGTVMAGTYVAGETVPYVIAQPGMHLKMLVHPQSDSDPSGGTINQWDLVYPSDTGYLGTIATLGATISAIIGQAMETVQNPSTSHAKKIEIEIM